MDRITTERRSWNMSRIRGRNSRAELIVRSVLHRMGYRFRLHAKELPGRPDVVLPKHNTVVFVHGCFWHRHPGCKYAYVPKSRPQFWMHKFDENIARDKRVTNELSKSGWKIVVVWECETTDENGLREKLARELDR